MPENFPFKDAKICLEHRFFPVLVDQVVMNIDPSANFIPIFGVDVGVEVSSALLLSRNTQVTIS